MTSSPDDSQSSKQSAAKPQRTKILAQVVVFSALAGGLYAVRIWTLPYGGSITLGSMVPVMWLSIRRGIKIGFIAGVVYGILAFTIDIVLVGAGNIIATPVQAVLEYPVAFGVIGLTGMFHRRTVTFIVAGEAIAVFIRFSIHVFAGYIFWVYVYAFPPQFGLWYPVVYNGGFLAVEFTISTFILVALVKRKALEYVFAD